MIKSGIKFNLSTAEGSCEPYKCKVLRAHRDNGYYETVILSGGHTARHGSIQIVSGAKIESNICD